MTPTQRNPNRAAKSQLFMVEYLVPSSPLQYGGCHVILPKTQSGAPASCIIHFVGGFGTSQTSYRRLLSDICDRLNAVVIVGAAPMGTNHLDLCRAVADSFETCYNELIPMLISRQLVSSSFVPTFGLGHSLGAKLLVLASCDEQARKSLGVRMANVLMSYNNFSIQDSIPQFEQLRNLGKGLNLGDLVQGFKQFRTGLEGTASMYGMGDMNIAGMDATLESLEKFLQGETIDFVPTPAEVEALIMRKYNVPSNCIIRFGTDTIDQSERLLSMLHGRFDDDASSRKSNIYRNVPGTHMTPATPPIDATAAESTVGRFTENPFVQSFVYNSASAVNEQLEDLLVVICAFIQIQVEMLKERVALPGSQEREHPT